MKVSALLLIAFMSTVSPVQGACVNHCSGHGVCGGNNVCTCVRGWSSADCSRRECPENIAWVDQAHTHEIHSPVSRDDDGIHIDAGPLHNVAFRWTLSDGEGSMFVQESGPIGLLTAGARRGTLTGDAVLTGASIVLGGADGYVTLPSTHFGGHAMSFSMWVKLQTAIPGACVLSFSAGVADTPDDEVSFGNAALPADASFAVGTGASAALETHEVSVVAFWDTWCIDYFCHVVAAVSAAGHMKLYKNGVLVGDVAGSVPRAIERVNNFLGKAAAMAGPFLHGAIKDFRVYYDELRVDEVEQIASGENVNEPHLVSHVNAHAARECSNKGVCDDITGQCVCDPLFNGLGCERMVCPSDCSGHGRCVSMEQHATLYGSSYDSVWDHDKIFGCICDEGYTGYDCMLRRCPTGDDPLTVGQSNELQLLQCNATGGHFTLTYKGFTTNAISYNDGVTAFSSALTALPSVKTVVVQFSVGTISCLGSGLNIISVEFTQDFGDLPPITAEAEWLTGATGTITPVATQDGKSLYESVSVKGTKENEECSNRGICDRSIGYCTCSADWSTSDGYGNEGTRGDCGYSTTSNIQCPGEVACSGHGVCDSTDARMRCSCSDGWLGADCSLMSCPEGRSWFDSPVADNDAHWWAECSNMGACDPSSGQCTCRDGFTGAACDIMKCPGAGGQCNGHGRCLPMWDLAAQSLQHGGGNSFTYGAKPNDNFRWDHNKLHGCLCDDRWVGYDCSHQRCPTGDNPDTRNQVKEIQVIRCTGTKGFWRIQFRGKWTKPIDRWASAVEVRRALESTTIIGAHDHGQSTIRYAQVEFSLPGEPACANASAPNLQYIQVAFEQELGDVPTMRSDASALVDLGSADGMGTVHIVNDGAAHSTGGPISQRGTAEDTECSNRGVCNRVMGTCSCFSGYGSSDGNGNYGTRGDCGSYCTSGDCNVLTQQRNDFLVVGSLSTGAELRRWRDDMRCGVHYAAPSGGAGQCDPTGAETGGPCCSDFGWCGWTDDHCACENCVNFGPNPPPPSPPPPSPPPPPNPPPPTDAPTHVPTTLPTNLPSAAPSDSPSPAP